MKTLQISEQKARELYKSESDEIRVILEDTFSKAFFNMPITERVKTYEDACSELGEQLLNEAELKRLGFTHDEIIYRKLKTITRALNEDHKPDMFDTDEKKWFPYFKVSSSGFAFYGTGYDCSIAGGASRLCLKSSELAEYAGQQFTDLYEIIING